jgi:hypothetical protein
MKWRRITEDEVMSVIAEPDKIEDSLRGRTNAYGSISERYLKVTYKKFDDRILVISVVDKAESRGKRDEDRV